jgi:aminopeptidase N
MSFIVGKWQKKRVETEPLNLGYYRTADVILPRLDFFEEAKSILRFYESRFGPYPYESLSIIHRIWQESGGHSPASFIVLNQLPRIQGVRLKMANSPVNMTRWSEYYLAHEIAHQWWGQGVTWDRHHDHWISEGMAQFSTILYLREKHGESAFSNILKKMSSWTKKKAKWGPIIFGSRISHFDFFAFQSIVYNKSSLVLNMLKDLLGDEVFFQGVKEFFDRNKYQAARTNDFIAALSKISQKDLEPFFSSWFESYTLPEIKVSNSVEKVQEEYRLKFHIVQETDPFIFPLWVEWIQDGKKIRKMIVVDNKEHTVEFKLNQKPKNIRINPDEAIPGYFH